MVWLRSVVFAAALVAGASSAISKPGQALAGAGAEGSRVEKDDRDHKTDKDRKHGDKQDDLGHIEAGILGKRYLGDYDPYPLYDGGYGGRFDGDYRFPGYGPRGYGLPGYGPRDDGLPGYGPLDYGVRDDLPLRDDVPLRDYGRLGYGPRDEIVRRRLDRAEDSLDDDDDDLVDDDAAHPLDRVRRTCFRQNWLTRRYRITDLVCADKKGFVFIADRDYYPVYRGGDGDDDLLY